MSLGSPMSESDLPRIGKPATRALAQQGIVRLDQLSAMSEAQLLALHGVGPKAIAILRAALDAAGRDPPAGLPEPHRFSVRVYYEDTDFSGIVYHAAYLHFFERARTEFLRSMGVHHSELIREGIAFAVRSMAVEFDAAARIDDLLEVETRVESLTPARLRLDQRILRDGVVVTRASVLVVTINGAGRAARMPKTIHTALTPR